MKVGMVLKNGDIEKYGNTHSIRKLLSGWIYNGNECLARRDWVVVSKYELGKYIDLCKKDSTYIEDVEKILVDEYLCIKNTIDDKNNIKEELDETIRVLEDYSVGKFSDTTINRKDSIVMIVLYEQK